jgi:hypothetical protein
VCDFRRTAAGHSLTVPPGLPDPAVQRSLTWVAKIIQNLANLNPSVQREEVMRPVQTFLKNSLDAMKDYLIAVSTPVRDQRKPSLIPGPASASHERAVAFNALRERRQSLPVLAREAIPLVPGFLDVPRHLAVISSAVVRYSKNYQRPKRTQQGRDPIDDLCARCYKVETRALR